MKHLVLVAIALCFGGLACENSSDTSPPVTPASPTSQTDPGSHAGTSSTTTAQPEILTIYLASGDGKACQRYDASGCTIDALTFNVADNKLSALTEVVETKGAFSPSISPDGSRIAFDRNDGSNHLIVTVRSLADSSETELEIGSGDKSNWRTNDELLFGMTSLENSKDDRWADLAHVTLNNGAPLSIQGELERYLGAVSPLTQQDSSDCSGEDPFTHPSNRNLVALHTAPYWSQLAKKDPHSCPWMKDVPNQDHKNPQPIVVDITATAWIEGQTYWRFKMTWDTPFPGCAHLAFSPDGSRVLCTDQPTFYYEDHTPANGPTYPIGFNRIYGFELAKNDAGVNEYVSVRGTDALFKHTHPASLKDNEQIWDQSLRCDVYYTKRADFCGAKTRIVANVYCIDQSDMNNLKTAFSRVMLIDFKDPNKPVYTDLTSQIEDQRGVPRGSISSFTAACQQPKQ